MLSNSVLTASMRLATRYLADQDGCEPTGSAKSLLLAGAAAIDRLSEESYRFYRADGSYELLGSPEEVIERRKQAAVEIDRLRVRVAELEAAENKQTEDHPESESDRIRKAFRSMNRVLFTKFGQTRLVPLRIYENGVFLSEPDPIWDREIWIERPEDYYGLDKKRGRILVVDREDWIKSPDISTLYATEDR